ncbi:MAG: transposase, partial [Ktedonobacterales bacterium]
RQPVPRLVRWLFGKLLGDRGYISESLAEALLVEHGIHLVTKARKNMRGRLLALADKLLLRKRAIIESVNDQLKNVCLIEHTRHRSPYNFLAHLLAGLVAYCHLPKKPSLHLDCDLLRLPAA